MPWHAVCLLFLFIKIMLNKFKIDWILFLLSALLLAVGLSVLYSIALVTPKEGMLDIFWRQIIFAILGIVAMIFFATSNIQALKSHSTLIYFLTLGMLALVLVFGRTINGTQGWIGFGSFHIQPVEISKLTLIIFLASFISQKKMELEETGRLMASSVLCFIMILMVLKQPDFGSAMVLTGIWLGMTLVSGVSTKKFAAIFLVGIVVAVFAWFHLQPYQKDRLISLVNPSSLDPRGAGYNVIQSVISVGSGGMIGEGIGHGSQSQLNFLPEKHTDFIFASISEQLGFVGSIFVIILYGLMFWRMRLIAKNTQDNFSYLVTVGVMIMLFVQVLENIGMNIGIMPVTGIPLPLLSYGGSSLIIVMASVGILSNIHSKREYRVYEE
jgi:rod shape determining protein RodA